MHGEYTPEQVQGWREKAEKWDDLQSGLPISSFRVEYENQKLEAVKAFLWKNRYMEENIVREIYKILGYDLRIVYDEEGNHFELEEILGEPQKPTGDTPK